MNLHRSGYLPERTRFGVPMSNMRRVACVVPAISRDAHACYCLCAAAARATLHPSSGYSWHRPETTLLYRLFEQHYPIFREMRSRDGRSLPDYVEQEFDAWLKCGRSEAGFLRVRCEHCHAEKLVAFSCKERGFCPSCGARRMAETAVAP